MNEGLRDLQARARAKLEPLMSDVWTPETKWEIKKVLATTFNEAYQCGWFFRQVSPEEIALTDVNGVRNIQFSPDVQTYLDTPD